MAFDIIPDGKYLSIHYTKASGNLIFDVRTLEHRARWVKYGHKNPQPERSTFSGVVSHQSIIIALTYASLNDLPVFGYNIQNAYLQHYIICGTKFGLDNEDRISIIVQALYGGKSSGADYWCHV